MQGNGTDPILCAAARQPPAAWRSRRHAARQDALNAELTALLEKSNTAGRDSLVVPGEYLEVVIVKR